MTVFRKIKFPDGLGITEISIDGNVYKADELGTFEVPVDHAANLLRTYGGEYDPTPEQIDARVDAAKAAVAHAEMVLSVRREELKAMQAAADAYKKRIADARAKLEPTPPAPPNGQQKQTLSTNQQNNQRR